MLEDGCTCAYKRQVCLIVYMGTLVMYVGMYHMYMYIYALHTFVWVAPVASIAATRQSSSVSFRDGPSRMEVVLGCR